MIVFLLYFGCFREVFVGRDHMGRGTVFVFEVDFG